MSVEAVRKEATEMVCILLEKEKNREGILFTSMRDLSRKVGKENIGPKEVANVIKHLESIGVVKTLKKNNRQTVLEISDDLLCKDIYVNLGEGEVDNKKLEKVSITPNKLYEFIVENMSDYKLSVTSKTMCDEFNCKYAQLMASLNLLQRADKLSFTFKHGVVDIIVNEEKAKEVTKEEKTISFYSNVESTKNVEHSEEGYAVEIDGVMVNVDSIFNEIGETMESVFEKMRKLTEENAELHKKLAISEIALKRMREDRDCYALRCEQMKERNNRLYNQVIELKNK